MSTNGPDTGYNIWNPTQGYQNDQDPGTRARSAYLAQQAARAGQNFANPVNAPQGDYTAANSALGSLTGQAAALRGTAQGMGGYMGQLEAGAAGNGPSLADLQDQAAASGNTDAALRAQASGRGNAGLANLNAGNQAYGANIQAALGSGAQKQAEMMQAYGQMGGAYNTMGILAGAAANAYGQAGKLYGNEAESNAQAKAQYMQQQDALSQGYTQDQVNYDLAQQKRQQDLYQQWYNTANTFSGAAQQDRATNQGLVSNVVGGAGKLVSTGAMLAMSDRNVKHDVSDGDSDVRDALKTLRPYSYDYDHPEQHGEGRQYGVMAQDLASTPAGRPSVVQTRDGLAIDPAKATGLMLAGLGSIERRLSKVEGKK